MVDDLLGIQRDRGADHEDQPEFHDVPVGERGDDRPDRARRDDGDDLHHEVEQGDPDDKEPRLPQDAEEDEHGDQEVAAELVGEGPQRAVEDAAAGGLAVGGLQEDVVDTPLPHREIGVREDVGDRPTRTHAEVVRDRLPGRNPRDADRRLRRRR